MTTPFLADDLKHDEGCRLNAYPDPVSPLAKTGQGSGEPWTIGYGHAGVAEGAVWTQPQCDDQLAQDIAHAKSLLNANAPWWTTLDDARQDVMVNLCFNMGWGNGAHGLSSFKNTLKAIEGGTYAKAAAGLLASQWARQVKTRATRLAKQMETGVRVAP